jgi:hypothetical protein
MGWLSELPNEYPALEPARERLAAIDAQLTASDRENSMLKAENDLLHKEIAALRQQVTHTAASTQFTEAGGVLWKSKRGGGHETGPYCPTCQSPLADYSGSLLCLKCNWQAPIKSFEVPRVFHDMFGGE